MIAIILFLLMLSAGVGLSLLSGEDSGYLLLAWNGWRVEINNLVVAFALALALFLLLHWLLNSFAAMQRGRKLWRDWRLSRGDRNGQRTLMLGLRQLAEGRWQLAEKKLLRAAERSRTPLLAYLGAAQAADQLGSVDRRDRYLATAARAGDNSDLAIGLLRARVLWGSGQIDQALAVLVKLQKSEPHHPQALKLLQQIYLQSDDWRGLLELLPQLRRQKLIDHSEALALSRQCHLQLLKTADNLQDAWRHMPKKYAHDPEMLSLYLQVLITDGQTGRALELLQRELNRELDDRLLKLYGNLDAEDSTRQLNHIENWLLKAPTNPALLHAAGRIAVRAELIERAVNYYEALVPHSADPVACNELAKLYSQRQQPELALKCLERGLELAL